MMSIFYITTPIYYPNAPPHIGHAYTTVFADVMARYHRLVGDEVFFITGNDEHGLKLQRVAEKKGIHPKQFVDEMADVYRKYWGMLDISYDYFIRTTDEYHEKTVKTAIQKLYDKGLIYKASYAGWYCVDCEKFYSPGEYVEIDGKPYCPIHKKPLEWLEEETYYFKLSEFEDFIIDVLKNKDIIYPRSYALEVLGKVEKEGLRDVSIARPKERVWWGIEVPFDKNYTVYVWFDALLNYISGIGYLEDMDRFNKYWPNVHHVIGKDILWFHTVIWFSILKALDIELPKKLLVHAFLINRGLKIGKSAGNVIAIEDLINRYQDSDGVRYILMRVFNMDKDVDVSTELFDSIYNSELADTMGNLIRRIGVLAKKKLGGIVYKREVNKELSTSIMETLNKYNEYMKTYDVSRAIQTVMDLLRKANAYVNMTRPWEKIDPGKELYSLLETVRASTTMLYPIIPKAASKISNAFGFSIGNPAEYVVGEIERYNIVDAPILFRKIKQ
ncbi:methionine--tRNA ligase [Staphylothermus hellenicus]|uniref:methionine--tRNA ligase n=1 Tax=Staphylothermus hellenicus (strain DSM 12710 / JCM 10830 / BK20S6-10-b1 / P8) TaxID=591019 RepID=D7D8E3_STAHD|nr:methionine--tRNA ligase [Staphylothermus hellenicus]ADI32039.1 methionyl-tRNA synthetase [Staphylothermus hellenicus DSM 12710]